MREQRPVRASLCPHPDSLRCHAVPLGKSFCRHVVVKGRLVNEQIHALRGLHHVWARPRVAGEDDFPPALGLKHHPPGVRAVHRADVVHGCQAQVFQRLAHSCDALLVCHVPLWEFVRRYQIDPVHPHIAQCLQPTERHQYLAERLGADQDNGLAAAPQDGLPHAKEAREAHVVVCMNVTDPNQLQLGNSLAGGVKAKSPDHLAVGVLPAVEHHSSTLKQVDVDARDVAVLAGHGRTGAEQSDLTLIPWDVRYAGGGCMLQLVRRACLACLLQHLPHLGIALHGLGNIAELQRFGYFCGVNPDA
mmetsp:Transcript_3023/g.7549  ORF Transcript_3023/g.7549 Transcript_3023/m.7549 type:complete len:304 (+) Transcript_3023:458-1369(+)